MTYFPLRDYNILPNKELHWSLWVDIGGCFVRELLETPISLDVAGWEGRATVRGMKLCMGVGVGFVEGLEAFATRLFGMARLLRLTGVWTGLPWVRSRRFKHFNAEQLANAKVRATDIWPWSSHLVDYTLLA